MRKMLLGAVLLTAVVSGPVPAWAGHPVVDALVGHMVGKAIDKHQQAGERLGYPPLMPPIPGAVSPNHRNMIEQIEREKFYRELQRSPDRIEKIERRGRTG